MTLGVAPMFFIVLIVAGIFATMGAYVASQKRRASMEGAIFGGLLGPIGILIVALLPTGPQLGPGDYGVMGDDDLDLVVDHHGQSGDEDDNEILRRVGPKWMELIDWSQVEGEGGRKRARSEAAAKLRAMESQKVR